MPILTERSAPRGVEAPPAPQRLARSGFRLALVGNPNTGKTTLFNRLCGTRAKTSNFPGTTTAARIGRATLPGMRSVVEADVVDLPGIYRLSLETPESSICRDVLMGEGLYRKPDAVIVVVDACNLTRNLMLVGELLQFDEPVIVALNMVDIAQRRGLSLDASMLSAATGMSGRADRGAARSRTSSACRRWPRPRSCNRVRLTDGGAASEPLDQWADLLVEDERERRGRGDGHAHRASRQDVHASSPRRARVRRGDGGHVLDAVRARDDPDGSDRGDVCVAGELVGRDAAGRAGSRSRRRTGSSAASREPSCSCRRSACSSS